MTNPRQISTILRYAGFTPYCWDTNKEEFTLHINGVMIYVHIKKCILSVSRGQERLLTTAFSSVEELIRELAVSYQLASK